MSQNNEQLKQVLTNGQASEFWGTMLRIMDENVKFLEAQIISKTSLEDGHEGEELTDSEVDILRYKRSLQKDLMECPTRMLEQMNREGIEVEDLDPFYRNVDEIRGNSSLT